MKTGTPVKFVGAKNKAPIEKTYVWATAQIEQGVIYLIEHPDGVLLTEENKKDFVGFNPEKLQAGKKYLVAYSGQLIDLSQPTEAIAPTTNNQQPTTITVTMPKEYFENIKGFLESQKEAMEKNPLVKFQMKKAEFAEMMAFYTQLIDDTNKALAQAQQTLPSEALAKDVTTNNQQPLTSEALAKDLTSNI